MLGCCMVRVSFAVTDVVYEFGARHLVAQGEDRGCGEGEGWFWGKYEGEQIALALVAVDLDPLAD